MRPFIAFIRRQSDADFRASFPDFPGCVACGKTIAEAQRNAGQALAFLCGAGVGLPEPSYMHDLYARRECTDGLLVLIAPPALKPPADRKAAAVIAP
jgi:predicted RNase H-like HicB family nuclease